MREVCVRAPVSVYTCIRAPVSVFIRVHVRVRPAGGRVARPDHSWRSLAPSGGEAVATLAVRGWARATLAVRFRRGEPAWWTRDEDGQMLLDGV